MTETKSLATLEHSDFVLWICFGFRFNSKNSDFVLSTYGGYSATKETAIMAIVEKPIAAKPAYKVIGTRPIRHDGVDKVTGRAIRGRPG
jgi:hypothetical protein